MTRETALVQPQTRYARRGDVNIAYKVVGEGPLDLVYVPGFVSHVELVWEELLAARALDRLATFSRLILFDERGTGLRSGSGLGATRRASAACSPSSA